MQLVSSLDDHTALVLNGDTIDNPRKRLAPQDTAVLDLIKDESYKRQVIWVYGNHDEGYQLDDPGQIVFVRHLAIGTDLMVIHGNDFDELMPRNQWFIRLCKRLHRLRIKLGASPVHVAEFAKNWFPLLYRILSDQVKKNAVKCAMKNGVSAIACGHTHYIEDCLCNGIRYINTGTWTEPTRCYIMLTDGEITVIRV